jgi:hypothetical protein
MPAANKGYNQWREITKYKFYLRYYVRSRWTMTFSKAQLRIAERCAQAF